jgi:hypothetical protein
MSDLNELIRQWEDLLEFSSTTTESDSENPLEFIREDRVLELTNDYIGKLSEVQAEHDCNAVVFANRVRQRAQGEGIEAESEFLEEMCQRLIGGLEATLFNEIPKSVPRAERASAETLEISWESDPATASWKEVDVSFTLQPVISFCAQHSARADGEIRKLLVEQLMSDLRGGVAKIGMALESHSDSKSVFVSQPAVVSLASSTEPSEQPAASPDRTETPVPRVAPLAPAAFAPAPAVLSAMEVYLRDTRQYLAADVRFAGNMSDLTLEVTLKFDDMDELPNNDPMHDKIKEIVAIASENNAERAGKIVDAMSSAAFFGMTIAEASNNEALFIKRGRVLKGIKVLKNAHRSGETEFA